MVSINRLRTKRPVKATKMKAESLDEQYIGIGIHTETMFKTWVLTEVSELQHINTYHWSNRMFQRDKQNE